jgi:hypothetical protein
VHHLTLHECDLSTAFDDANLLDGLCDDIAESIKKCKTSVAIGWAVGGYDVSLFLAGQN